MPDEPVPITIHTRPMRNHQPPSTAEIQFAVNIAEFAREGKASRDSLQEAVRTFDDVRRWLNRLAET
jgi:hypothetical protein